MFSFLNDRYSVDRIVQHAVVAIQFLLLAVCLVPAVQHELMGPPAPVSHAFGPAAWILAGVLAVTLFAALWDAWREEDLVTTLLMAATIPGLIAGRFATNSQLGAPAAASALRWGLSIAMLIVSAAIWQRARLATWLRRAGFRPAIEKADWKSATRAAAVARGVTLATMAAPVLLITVCAASLQLGGTKPLGPTAPSFFANLGPSWSYLVPLALVMISLVGFAIRERSSGHAFSAGLVLELAVTLGYALHVSLSKQKIDATTFFVALLHWATIAAAVWAILWLLARRWLDVWREEANEPLPGILMNMQIGMAAAGNAILLGGALSSLAIVPLGWQRWTIDAGRLPGWFALVLPVVAVVLRGRLRPNVAGLVGMAMLGLLACTVRGLDPVWHFPVDPVWGYRTLMLGWAVYALVVVAAAWWAASLRMHHAKREEYSGPPQALLRMAAVWVRAASILAVLLGLKAAFFHSGEQLWAAVAIALASGASATMAVWRRREGWAFATAWGVNLAASLVVWHFELQQHLPFEQWWLRLVQANIIATSTFALVWLAARRRLYELRELSLGESPLLALQILAAVVANGLLLIPPVAAIFLAPQSLPTSMAGIGLAPGWLGLVLTVAAAGWYLSQTLPGNLIHVLGGLLLATGVLAACAVSVPGVVIPYDIQWPAYHALVVAWTAAAAIFLLAGIFGGLLSLWVRVRARAFESASLPPLLPANLVDSWLGAFGALAIGLTLLHGFHDPLRPGFPAGAVLAVSGIAAATALWRRRVAYVYTSSVLINAAGILIWWAKVADGIALSKWTAEIPVSFLASNALCLAVGSVLWSLLGRLGGLAKADGAAHARGLLDYCIQAAWLGTALVALVVAVGLTGDLSTSHIQVTPLDWIALLSIAAAAGVCLWQRSPRAALQMFYCLGLAAAGMWLWSNAFAPKKLCWIAGGELACFTLAAAAVGWLLSRSRAAWTALGIPADAEDQDGWFSRVQAFLMLIATGLAVWVSTDASFNGIGMHVAQFELAGRTAGPLALLIVLGTTIVMAATCRTGFPARPPTPDRLGGPSYRAAWQFVAFACGVLLGSCLRWSLMDANLKAPWLHGEIAVILAAAVVACISGFGLKFILPRDSDWTARAASGPVHRRPVGRHDFCRAIARGRDLPIDAEAGRTLGRLGNRLRCGNVRRHDCRRHCSGRRARVGPAQAERPPAADLRLPGRGDRAAHGFPSALHDALALPRLLPAILDVRGPGRGVFGGRLERMVPPPQDARPGRSG